MLALISHLLIAAVGLGQAEDTDGRSTAARQIADLTSRLQNISCSFEYSEDPTPEFINLVTAELANAPPERKKSSAEIKKQYGQDAKSTFVESRDQRYYFDCHKKVEGTTTASLEDGRSYDGETSWGWRKLVFKDGTDGTDVEKSIDPQRPHVAEELLRTGTVTRKFLALSLLKFGGSLIQRILENPATTLLPDQAIDGEPCLVFQLVENLDRGTGHRTTLWLDRSKQYLLRKLQEEYKTKKSPGWFVFNEFVTIRINSVPLPGEGRPSTLLWFPCELRKRTYNENGAHTFSGHVLVTDYRFNADLASIEFTPRLEDGTNLRDAVTGKTSVVGRGPSPRIKAMIRKRVEESREQIKGLEEVDLSQALAPPRTWSDALPWLAASLGLIGLLFVAGRRLRDRSKVRSFSQGDH